MKTYRLGQSARRALALLIIGGFPLAVTAEDRPPDVATGHQELTRQVTPSPQPNLRRHAEEDADAEDRKFYDLTPEVRIRISACVDGCEGLRNECAADRDLQSCLTEERLCITECDSAALSRDTRHARAQNSLYRERPDLLRMRLDHERNNPGAVCRERCDDSARLCTEISRNNPEPCQEGRTLCRERCPVDDPSVQ